MLQVNKLGRSIAIEPDPDNFRMLDHNVVQNGFGDRVVRVHCAVSAQEGELELERSSVNFGDHRIRMVPQGDVSEAHDESKRSTVRVPARRVDDILRDTPAAFVRDIAFVWIDVQGHEGYAFQGAEDLLARDVPVVAEFWPYGIRRAGMTEAEFNAIARRFWSGYWLQEGSGASKKFVHYPITHLERLFAEIGYNDSKTTNKACNIIFTK